MWRVGQVSPSLFSAMGFESLVIGRVNDAVLKFMKRGGGLEFVWRGVPQRGASRDIFTHVLPHHQSVHTRSFALSLPASRLFCFFFFLSLSFSLVHCELHFAVMCCAVL